MDGYKFEKAELDALQRVVGDATAEPMTMTLPLLKHITNDFSTEIGTGGFATVYLGTLPNGSRIAVRRLSQSYSMDARAFYHEVKITREAAHKNIVRLIGLCDHTEEKLVEYKGKQVCAEFSEMLLCTEYVTNGTLDKHITACMIPIMAFCWWLMACCVYKMHGFLQPHVVGPLISHGIIG